MDKVSFIVETLANINQSILLIYFLCGTLNVNKKINSKIAVISGVSIIFAYLEIQYMVVPFEGLGVGILWAMLVIYACLFMDGNIFQKMYASMFIIATIIFVTVLLGSIMGALYNVHFIEFTGTASMEKCLLVILIQITIWLFRLRDLVLAYCGQCLLYMRAFLWMAIYFRKCMLQCLL